MRDPTHTKQIASASPSPSPYPVSTRAYKKKDYEYLSSFPRMVHSHSVLKVTPRSDTQILQERIDCESDLSMTTSSVGYTTSISSASSTSSGQSYGKDLIVSMDSEGHYQHQHYHHHNQQQQQQQQQQLQHQHHLFSTETCTHSPRISMDCADSSVETKDDKLGDKSSADMKDDDKLDIGDFPGTEKAVKLPVRSRSKPKSRPHTTPAVLPKFGSWDTRNPSSGEAYTLIFRRLRDEKKSGGLTMCTSPTHSKEEEAAESPSQESKAKESLHSNAGVRKDSSRRKAKGASHQEAAYNRKPATRWNLCCKASVLDD